VTSVSKKKDSERPEESAKKAEGAPSVQAGGWDDTSVKVKSRTFPGPAGATEALRIAMTKEAYADLVAHAKGSVDREICGVLLGDLCEDEHGFFVEVSAAVRGTAAKTGGMHVTFTQETWNEIHKEKEARYPKLQIVGWYHSHPGFGVEFSDMDMFIQRNFFSGPSQIAFVSDPLGGEEAICANTDGGIKSIRRFWVDGRERRCYVPPEQAAASSGDGKAGTPAVGGDVAKTLHELEDRIRQLTDVVEKQRNTFYSFLTFVGVLMALCLIGSVAYSMYRSYARPVELPQAFSEVGGIPAKIDGKDTLLTLKIQKWDVPPEWGVVMVSRADLERLLRTQKMVDEVGIQAATQAAATQEATPSFWSMNPMKMVIIGAALVLILLLAASFGRRRKDGA
jgi:proteasome lid subunit RPN8/RPN11